MNRLDHVTQHLIMRPPSHGLTNPWFGPGVGQGLGPWLELGAGAARFNIVPPYFYPYHLERGFEIGPSENLVRGLNAGNIEGRTDGTENVGSGTDQVSSMELDLTLRL